VASIFCLVVHSIFLHLLGLLRVPVDLSARFCLLERVVLLFLILYSFFLVALIFFVCLCFPSFFCFSVYPLVLALPLIVFLGSKFIEWVWLFCSLAK